MEVGVPPLHWSVSHSSHPCIARMAAGPRTGGVPGIRVCAGPGRHQGGVELVVTGTREASARLWSKSSVVVRRRIASFARGGWCGWTIVVVGMLLIELIICELLVLIVHVPPAVPVVPVPLLPGDELDGQAVWPDVLNFTDRFCRGRHILSDVLLLSSCDQSRFPPAVHRELAGVRTDPSTVAVCVSSPTGA